jgi:traG/traD family protein
VKVSKGKIFFASILAVLAWWCANKVTWQVRTDQEAGRDFSQIIDRFTLDLTAHPLHVSFAGADVLGGFGGIALVLLIALYMYGARKPTRPGEEQGSARWAKPSEARKFVGDRKTDMLFTRTESLNLDSRKTQRNLNALIIGSSGSGKSRYYVMPNLAQANTSFLVTDPKGEVQRAMGQRLKDKGYEIRSLNLIDFDRSDTFNPLRYFNPEQAEVDCAILVENLITNTSGQKPSGNSDFWEKAERALLTAFVSYIYFTKGAQGTLIDVVDMLAKMQASEENEEATSEVDAIFSVAKECVEVFDQNPDEYDEEATIMLNGLRFACSQYNIYTQGAGETKKSIIISLGVRMAPLHMAQLRRILGSDTIDADQVGKRRSAIFLVIPDSHQAFSFIASIFYELFFERNMYLADHNPSGRLEVPVQCFMDEFANIGKLPSFERKIAVIRSRGISTSIIMQTYAQGKSLYKDDWETIVGNCDSLLFLGGNEPSTTEFISKRLGKETIISQDTSEQKGTNGSWSRSLRSQGRELMTPDEIGRLDGGTCLYLLRGIPPFKSRKLQAPETGFFEYIPVASNTEVQESPSEEVGSGWLNVQPTMD